VNLRGPTGLLSNLRMQIKNVLTPSSHSWCKANTHMRPIRSKVALRTIATRASLLLQRAVTLPLRILSRPTRGKRRKNMLYSETNRVCRPIILVTSY
jgi:hypothetical protein